MYKKNYQALGHFNFSSSLAHTILWSIQYNILLVIWEYMVKKPWTFIWIWIPLARDDSTNGYDTHGQYSYLKFHYEFQKMTLTLFVCLQKMCNFAKVEGCRIVPATPILISNLNRASQAQFFEPHPWNSWKMCTFYKSSNDINSIFWYS